MKLDIYQSLEKLKGKSQETKWKPPMHIYQDESTGQIKEVLLDSAGARVHINPAKIIHDSIFHH